MFLHFLLVWGGVCAAYAQTTASSPFLARFLNLSDYSISTVGGDDTHTTYNIKCDADATLCTLPAAGATVVTAPSYVELAYTVPSRTFTSVVECTYIDARASAVCVTEQAFPTVVDQSGSSISALAMGTTTVTLPSASVALGFNTAATTNANVRTTEGVVSATGTASHSETATTTGAAVSATKTGGASEVFGHRNSGLIVGAAMFGISFLSSALVSAF